MTSLEAHDPQSNGRKLSATRVGVSTVGAVGGFFSIEHGFFEILQGNVPTEGLIIDAIGPTHEFWEAAFGHSADRGRLALFLTCGTSPFNAYPFLISFPKLLRSMKPC